MLVLVSFLVCMGSFVNGDLTLGLKGDSNMMMMKTISTRSCIDKERQTLLFIKENLVDIHNLLRDWGSEEEKRDCCKWYGVRCNNHTGHVIGLDLSDPYNRLNGKFSPSLQLLSQLRYLNLSGIDFQSNPIPNFLGSLSNLQYLDISGANISGPLPHQLGNLSDLLHLDLSRNFLTGSIPFSFGYLTSLIHLDISNNQLEGSIPNSFGNSSSLVQLNLSENLFNGSYPNFVGCSSMKELILHRNALHGQVPNITGCSSLTNLSLGYNFFNGSIPDFTGCQFLRRIDLSSNSLSGDLPNSVGQISNLEYLDVSSNYLKGVISDVHVLNLTRLTYLDMSFNSFAFELSSFVRIPFQLKTIKLQSCKLGPKFPIWIQNQTSFTHLDISNARISDNVPAWFWDLPFKLRFLNISSNEIRGTLPNMTANFFRYPGIDLSNNRLEGRVSKMPSELAALNLSGNRFSGTLDFLCQIARTLTFLDLSNNSFSGFLPDCWLKFQEKLVVLNLSNNDLSGEIPSSLGFLSNLQALYLRRNAFSGELPRSLSNCRKLRFVDFGENKLSGNIPAWIGERLSKLYILVLRSNRFYGSLPSQICWLNNLQYLDMSMNGLSGNIPQCFGNLTAMASRGVRVHLTNHIYFSYEGTLHPNYGSNNSVGGPFIPYFAIIKEGSEQALFFDNTLVAWKGKDREFGKSVLELLKSIDLSSNNLSGKLPYEITSLVELVSLNLSTNKLHGEVPKHMGRLKSLQSLDLSRNYFSGNIPSSLSQVASLSYLDLSNNNLSGRIPTGTQLQSFNSSFYSGNPLLCGPPLTRKCGFVPVDGNEDDEEDVGDLWKSYYTGMGSGFAVGFWGICSVLFFNRRCRHFLFASLSNVKDWIYVKVAVHFRNIQIKFTRIRGRVQYSSAIS